MGYSKKQIHDLQSTINHVDCDLVLCATPVNLSKLLSINKAIVRIGYEYKDHGNPLVEDVLMKCLQKLNKGHNDE
jgi:predicted GTPase